MKDTQAELDNQKANFLWLIALPLAMMNTSVFLLGLLFLQMGNPDFDMSWGMAAIAACVLLFAVPLVFLYRALSAYCAICKLPFTAERVCVSKERVMLAFHFRSCNVCNVCVARKSAINKAK